MHERSPSTGSVNEGDHDFSEVLVGVTAGRSRSGVMTLPESIGGSADRRGDRGNAVERWVAGFGSVPGEGGDLAGLNLFVLVEENGEGADESAGVAAVLGNVLAETRISPACSSPTARYWASGGMKSLMLAVTSARVVAVARVRIWSSGMQAREGSATAASTSWALPRSCWAMVSRNISSSSSGMLTGCRRADGVRGTRLAPLRPRRRSRRGLAG